MTDAQLAVAADFGPPRFRLASRSARGPKPLSWERWTALRRNPIDCESQGAMRRRNEWGRQRPSPEMTIAAGFSIAFALLVLNAFLAGSRTTSRAALALSTLLLPLPALVHGHPLPRGLLAFVLVLVFARAVDSAFGVAPTTFASRLGAAVAWLAFIDIEVRSRRLPHFNRGAALHLAAAAAAVVMACAVWPLAESWPFPLRYVLRSACAGIIFVAFAESLSSLVKIVGGTLGVELNPVHDEPHRSRTVLEFWSRRWNLVAARWFRRYFFVPALSRGVTVALLSMFTVSALMHAYLIVAIDRRAAISWAVFFLAQPIVIVTERRLGVRAWPPAAGRIWTLAVFVALLPLLVKPVLPLFGTSL